MTLTQHVQRLIQDYTTRAAGNPEKYHQAVLTRAATDLQGLLTANPAGGKRLGAALREAQRQAAKRRYDPMYPSFYRKIVSELADRLQQITHSPSHSRKGA